MAKYAPQQCVQTVSASRLQGIWIQSKHCELVSIMMPFLPYKYSTLLEAKNRKMTHAAIFFLFADVTKSHRWKCSLSLFSQKAEKLPPTSENWQPVIQNEILQIISDIQREVAADETPQRCFPFISAASWIAAVAASVCQTKKLAKGENDMGSIFSQNPPPTAHKLSPSLSHSLFPSPWSFLFPCWLFFCTEFHHELSVRPSHSSLCSVIN